VRCGGVLGVTRASSPGPRDYGNPVRGSRPENPHYGIIIAYLFFVKKNRCRLRVTQKWKPRSPDVAWASRPRYTILPPVARIGPCLPLLCRAPHCRLRSGPPRANPYLPPEVGKACPGNSSPAVEERFPDGIRSEALERASSLAGSGST